MNGLLFPGQGSQAVGMGYNLYNKLSAAKTLLHEANEILEYDLKKIMFEGPQNILTDTRYAQPAIYTCSAMYLEMLKAQGIAYEYTAGHSLGEYNALLAAEVFDFCTGLSLVKARGEAMSLMNGRGTMAAVLGMTEEELQPNLTPGVVMANLNSKTQIVISGPEEEIDEIGNKLTVDEKIKFRKLNVSAAFHSPQMKDSADKMKDLIEGTAFSEPSCYVISNVSGTPSRELSEIKNNLLAQITGQVRWYDTIMSMKEAGVKTLYEVGYGDVLKKMNKTITFRPKCVSLEIEGEN
ncbi:MAG: ACP S-malonyltransferase [Mogibacterium sp.]|nr:ACP S-malonyltransferase [Mogibacterium sp.]